MPSRFSVSAISASVRPRRQGGDQAEERPRFTVWSGCKKPKDCFTATCYRGHWFWIDDRDVASKHLLSSLMFLFTFVQTGAKDAAPVLTIPTTR